MKSNKRLPIAIFLFFSGLVERIQEMFGRRMYRRLGRRKFRPQRRRKYERLQRRRHRLERKNEEKARQINEEKIQFLTDICHELRDPLTLMMGQIQQLSAQNTDKESENCLNIIYKQANRMKELIDSAADEKEVEKEMEKEMEADETFLSKLNVIIESNLEQSKISIPFLCREIGMSRTALYNKMRAITGMNIKDYINKIRMEKAIELVRSTSLSFSEISEKTGFTTSRYFSAVFKQYTGRTPSEYRTESFNPDNS